VLAAFVVYRFQIDPAMGHAVAQMLEMFDRDRARYPPVRTGPNLRVLTRDTLSPRQVGSLLGEAAWRSSGVSVMRVASGWARKRRTG
jgi:hypothetical protein